MYAYRGIDEVNEAALLVYEYRAAKTLSKLGYQLDANELTDLEVRAFLMIENEFDRLKADEMKRSSRSRGRG